MSKILIWRKVDKGNELDIFNKTDYKNLYQHIKSTQNGICPNWGNKLWFQGLISEIDVPENTITFRLNETIDEINNTFDMIIYPMANIFAKKHSQSLLDLSESLKNIKIPIYIIACGAQAKSYDHIDKLINTIGEQSKKFISTIYETGGEFALRGEFTKHFFDKLGFTSACVTGCPSLYQLGQNFNVNNNKYKLDELNPVFNGDLNYVAKGLKYYSNSYYMCQDHYFDFLYNKEQTRLLDFKKQVQFSIINNVESINFLKDNKIKMIADMPEWRNFLIKNNFNYSIGSRIHGNIMSILSGIPSTVIALDTRTREMAEFFDIPLIIPTNKKNYSIKQIEELYLEADYTKFNKNYKNRYLKYQQFLCDHKIISKINENNKFFKDNTLNNDYEKFIVSPSEYSKLATIMNKNKFIIKLTCKLYSLKNKH